MSEFESKVRKGLELVLFQNVTIRAASRIVDLHERTLQNYVGEYSGIRRSELQYVELKKRGKKDYLNEFSVQTLRLFALLLDFNEYPSPVEIIVEKMVELHCRENNKIVVDEPKPSLPTIHKIFANMGVPMRSLRKGSSVDILRSAKANEEYLGDWFSKLEEVRNSYKIRAQNVWNCDEVGLQFANMKLRVLTTRKCVRINLVTTDHLTVLITTNSVGSQIKPYLLFPGTDLSVVPDYALTHDECWTNYSPRGWMDIERFKVWMIKFVNEMKSRRNDEYVLLLVDGHSSRMDASTMFTAASNRILVLVGPSHLTQAWQPNDAGVNKAFKANMRHCLSEHLAARNEISNADLTFFTIKSLKEENMKTVIVNSFCYVCVEPLDHLRMARMIENERPDESLLRDPKFVLAVDMVKEHYSHCNHLVGEKRKRDEQEKVNKKLKKIGVTTSFACLLTSEDKIASLQLGVEYTKILKLKAQELHSEMLKMGWSLQELKQPANNRFKTMKDLHKLIVERLEKLHAEQEVKVRKALEEVLVHPPSIIMEVPSQTVSPPQSRNDETNVAKA